MARILYVEDDPLMRKTVTRMTQTSEHEFRLVGSREEALSVLKTEDFDILIVDYWLEPGTTGIGLFQELRSSKPGLACIVASGGSPYIEEEGVHELYKPFNLVELEEAINKVL